MKLGVGDGVMILVMWWELKDELSRFFYERGLLMELKEEKKDLFPMFRKSIP